MSWTANGWKRKKFSKWALTNYFGLCGFEWTQSRCVCGAELARTTDHHLSISWARWIQSTPNYPFNFNFNNTLPFSSRSLKWYLSFMFPHQNPVCICIYPMHATCPTHLILLDLITLIFRHGIQITKPFPCLMSLPQHHQPLLIL